MLFLDLSNDYSWSGELNDAFQRVQSVKDLRLSELVLEESDDWATFSDALCRIGTEKLYLCHPGACSDENKHFEQLYLRRESYQLRELDLSSILLDNIPTWMQIINALPLPRRY